MSATRNDGELENDPSSTKASGNNSSASSSEEKKSSPSASSDQEPLYMCLPGNYTGDKWHVALAMSLQKNLKLVFIQKPENQDTPFTQKQNQILKLLENFGLESRIISANFSSNARTIGKHTTNKIFKSHVGHDNPNAKKQYASTSLIMSHLPLEATPSSSSAMTPSPPTTVKLSVKPLQDILTTITATLSQEQKNKVDKRLELLKDSSKKYLLVNMRVTDYNHEKAR